MSIRTRTERAILFWAISAVLGIAASAFLGLQFLGAILDESSRNRIPDFIDVSLTGLVIGGGSKLLHDLITRVMKPKQPSAAGGG